MARKTSRMRKAAATIRNMMRLPGRIHVRCEFSFGPFVRLHFQRQTVDPDDAQPLPLLDGLPRHCVPDLTAYANGTGACEVVERNGGFCQQLLGAGHDRPLARTREVR